MSWTRGYCVDGGHCSVDDVEHAWTTGQTVGEVDDERTGRKATGKGPEKYVLCLISSS
jgi:hypothetical protein